MLKTEIVAEIGSNWEGSLEKARKIIYECKRAGADAVKFQMWRAFDLYSEKHPNWSIIKKSEISVEIAKKLKKISDDVGIEFFCSAFYPEAIDLLESLGVKRYKVASRTCLLKDPYAKETLERLSKTRKSVIISMGMGGDKNYLRRIFLKNKVIFCYCISEYPLDIKKINWRSALDFEGFSDHTLGITAPIIFTVLKKRQGSNHIIIEKHVKLKQSNGPDASTSIDTNQLADMISHIRIIEKTKLI
ncbi:MAG: N-acetylneuraminate synthase family protein [Nitrosopumilaceae archaeon]